MDVLFHQQCTVLRVDITKAKTKKMKKKLESRKKGGVSKAEEKEAVVALGTQQKYKHCLRKNNGNVTLVYSIEHLDMTSRGRQ